MAAEVKVTEDNVFQLLADYAQWKYDDDVLWRLMEECPYDLDLENGELVFKQLLTWIMFERKDPATGMTVLEEFVGKFIKHDSTLARKVLGLGGIIFDVFEVLERSGNTIAVRGSDGRKFALEVIAEHVHRYAPGTRVEGMIHPWGDTYRFTGITKMALKDSEIARELGLLTPDELTAWYEKKHKEDADSVIIRQSSTLKSMLNKMPYYWIDGICNSLHIDPNGRKPEKVRKIVAVLGSTRVIDIMKSLPDDALEAFEFTRA